MANSTKRVDQLFQQYCSVVDKSKAKLGEMIKEPNPDRRREINAELAKLNAEGTQLRNQLDAELDTLWKSD
jgi:chorismate-pyruvate lyase